MVGGILLLLQYITLNLYLRFILFLPPMCKDQLAFFWFKRRHLSFLLTPLKRYALGKEEGQTHIIEH